MTTPNVRAAVDRISRLIHEAAAPAQMDPYEAMDFYGELSAECDASLAALREENPRDDR